MSERTPIKPEDIREGDLIRYERGPGYVHADVAHEYVAKEDCDTHGYGHHAYYLLDRQAPKVDLPTEPTLGWTTLYDWLSGDERKPDLAFWCVATDGDVVRNGSSEGWTASDVTAFTPAVAVPKAALDEFRDAILNAEKFPPNHHCRNAARRFLSDVAEAGDPNV